jgi:hypothetical protein
MGSRVRTHLWSLTTDNPGYAVYVAHMLVRIPCTNTHIALYFCSANELSFINWGHLYYSTKMCRWQTRDVINRQ